MNTTSRDSLYLEGRRYSLFARPLDAYLRHVGAVGPAVDPALPSPAYHATWRVDAGMLWLVGLEGDDTDGSKLSIEDLFPGGSGKILAHWFSGVLRVPQGHVVPQSEDEPSLPIAREHLIGVVGGQIMCQGALEWPLRNDQRDTWNQLFRTWEGSTVRRMAALDGRESDAGSLYPTENPIDSKPAERPEANAESLVIRELGGAIQRLETVFEQRFAAADRSAMVIERLDGDLRRLKQREDDRRLEPTILAVAALIDGLDAIVADASREETGEAKGLVVKRLGVLRGQMAEALRRQNAEEFAPAVGETFDASRQEPVGTTAAERPENDLKIASVRRTGVLFGGRVIRPASVIIEKYPVSEAATT